MSTNDKAFTSQANCVFCDLMIARTTDKIVPLADTVLFENNGVIVVPARGMLMPGWLLIVSKRHALSFSRLMPDYAREVFNAISWVERQLKRTFGTPFFFEHGPSTSAVDLADHPIRSAVKACIEHAHIHAIPYQASLADFATDFDATPLGHLASLSAHGAHPSGYVFFRDGNGVMSVLIPRRDLPCQYIRRRMRSWLNKPEWDWYLCDDTDEVSDTLQRIGHDDSIR